MSIAHDLKIKIKSLRDRKGYISPHINLRGASIEQMQEWIEIAEKWSPEPEEVEVEDEPEIIESADEVLALIANAKTLKELGNAIADLEGKGVWSKWRLKYWDKNGECRIYLTDASYVNAKERGYIRVNCDGSTTRFWKGNDGFPSLPTLPIVENDLVAKDITPESRAIRNLNKQFGEGGWTQADLDDELERDEYQYFPNLPDAIATEIPTTPQQLELVPELPQIDRREWINPTLITIDKGTQTRTESVSKIEEYAEMMRDGSWDWTRSDIVIYESNDGAFPSDGHHRIMAAIVAGVEIFAEVKSGTLRDAIFQSFASNKFHGLPLSREDKNNRVRTILLDDEWQLMSDRAIADHCGVSAPLVGKVRGELVQVAAIAPTVQRTGKDGRSQASRKSGTKSKPVLVEADPIQSLPEQIAPVESLPEQIIPIPEFIASDIKKSVAIAIDSEGLETAKRIADTLTYDQLLELQRYISEICPEF